MKAVPVLSEVLCEEDDFTFFPLPIIIEEADLFPPVCSSSLLPENGKKPYFKFYKVFKNDTAVNEVFTNDFKPFRSTYLKIKTACSLHSAIRPAFSLVDDDHSYYGSLSRIKAMEHAKAGALKYIGKLIDGGEKSYNLLLQYREDHYEDLNINLVDRNIRKLERALSS
jgi:hypothetical protein